LPSYHLYIPSTRPRTREHGQKTHDLTGACPAARRPRRVDGRAHRPPLPASPAARRPAEARDPDPASAHRRPRLLPRPGVVALRGRRGDAGWGALQARRGDGPRPLSLAVPRPATDLRRGGDAGEGADRGPPQTARPDRAPAGVKSRPQVRYHPCNPP